MIYFAGVFAYVLGVKKVSLEGLGFSRQHLGNHLLIGLILGSLIVSALPLLDMLISVSGLEKNELFSESANQRTLNGWEELHPLSLAAQTLLFPLLTQIFFYRLDISRSEQEGQSCIGHLWRGDDFYLGPFQIESGNFFPGNHFRIFVSVDGNAICFHSFSRRLLPRRNPSIVCLSPIDYITGVPFLNVAKS